MVKTRGFWILMMFIVLIGLCVFEEIYVTNVLNGLKEKVNIFEQTVQLSTEETFNANVNEQILDLEQFWKMHENNLCLFINHRNMEELGEHLVYAKVLTEQNKKDELLEQVEQIKYYTQSYEHIMRANFQNIF